MGSATSVLLFVIVLALERGVISAAIGYAISVVLIMAAVTWTVRGSEKVRGLCELYLWLAFILSIYHLQVLSHAVAGRIGWNDIDVFRPMAVAQVLGVCAALWRLGAWSSDRETAGSNSSPARVAAGLFILGAVVFWLGARTFPGLALDRIQANPAGHLWTSANFLLATIITLVGLGLFTLALREAGDRTLSAVGLLIFAFGAVFWTLHLTVRMTVMVQAAQEWATTSSPPEWFEPWRAWAALLFGLYSVLAYLGLAAYGGALLTLGWRPRWAAWTCVFAGMFAAPLGGLPLFIHVPLWMVGIVLLTQRQPLAIVHLQS